MLQSSRTGDSLCCCTLSGDLVGHMRKCLESVLCEGCLSVLQESVLNVLDLVSELLTSVAVLTVKYFNLLATDVFLSEGIRDHSACIKTYYQFICYAGSKSLIIVCLETAQ